MTNPIETHPLPPFVMAHAQVLILGSFPPPKARWSMPFYYPNFNNDFWRIIGAVFFEDKEIFIDKKNKTFKQTDIEKILNNKGIAISDAAYQVRRLQNNASDKFLKVITPMDIAKLMQYMPNCTAIITTGEKAAQIVCQKFGVDTPKVGQSVRLTINRQMNLYRLPFSSRAYPLQFEQKVAVYRQLFAELDLLKNPRK